MNATITLSYTNGILLLLATEATLTTEHSASSYGLPVLVLHGTAYGPGDLGDHNLDIEDPAIAESARAAGFRVNAAPGSGWTEPADSDCTEIAMGSLTY